MDHHAYFAEGGIGNLNKLAVEAAHRLGVKIQGNVDVVVRTFSSFGVDDARDLKSLAELTPLRGKKLFVIGASAMTSDAQNALLKLFEEPTPNTFFVLLVPHGTLLSTLRSRCLRFHFETEGYAEGRKDAEHFLKGPYADRSAQVERLLKDKDREHVREFLNALETVLYEKKEVGAAHRKGKAQALADIALMRRYVGDRAPSLKMILEHLAATLPFQ